MNHDAAMHQGALFDASVAKTSFDLVISAEGDDCAETSSIIVISQDIARQYYSCRSAEREDLTRRPASTLPQLSAEIAAYVERFAATCN
ncbi:hypothetical protein [Sorangium sp. So ce128]|uniref:hypothetical protein n=1 Tax=Sorangium sp. So ce128 TaxID=3133281 RepID=UPI003F614A08